MFSYSDRYIQEFFIENRYPSRDTVRKVYEFLLARPEDPIELTLDQVREAIQVKDGSEAVGTAETLLAKAGVLKRLDSSSNHSVVRIDSDAPTMLDFLPREAKVRRRVMQAVETVVGKRRGEDVYVRPSRLAELADVDREQLARTLRELNKLKSFDYVPPFRGRAVHFIERDVPFEKLEIDFDELDRRKAAEYEKLESVIRFARTPDCRQQVILQYFGETGSSDCGTCDRCQPISQTLTTAASHATNPGPKSTLNPADQRDMLRGLQVILSGVTRMHGRFGKNLVAQMLCGSKNKKLQQWRLHQLSTYGLLSALKQSDVVSVMDTLIEAGLLEQREIDQRRPTIHITDVGREVMHARQPLPDAVTIKFPLARKLAAATRGIEAADHRVDSADGGLAAAETVESELEPAESLPADKDSPAAIELTEHLRRWRRKISAALGVPAYRVLTNATIERIVAAWPTTTEQLESISGIGPATIEQFGYDIVELIRQKEAPEALSETDSPEPAPQAATPQPLVELASDSTEKHQENLPASDSTCDWEASDAYWTWRLFRDGYSGSQIEIIRRCDSSLLAEELSQAADAGQWIDPAWISENTADSHARQAISNTTIGG
jgi:ATP-dependent DNA helicase RecQ